MELLEPQFLKNGWGVYLQVGALYIVSANPIGLDYVQPSL
jgi:hypothetical protein